MREGDRREKHQVDRREKDKKTGQKNEGGR